MDEDSTGRSLVLALQSRGIDYSFFRTSSMVIDIGAFFIVKRLFWFFKELLLLSFKF